MMCLFDVLAKVSKTKGSSMSSSSRVWSGRGNVVAGSREFILDFTKGVRSSDDVVSNPSR